MASTRPTTTMSSQAIAVIGPSNSGWMRTVSDRTTEMPRPGSSSGNSLARRAPSVVIAAWAWGTLTSSRNRAFTRKGASRVSRSRPFVESSNASMVGIESQKSVVMPSHQPLLCPSGPTPITVTGTPLSRMVSPITDGDASNVVVQAR